MSRRLLNLCVWAYPRDCRRSDGAFVRDLALELAEHHGVVGQAVSLLYGGFRERLRHRGRRWRLAATVSVAVTVVAGSAAMLAGPFGGEVEVYSCATRDLGDAGGCAEVERLAAARERQGWDCATRRRVIDGRRFVDLECWTDS
ncbi:MAG: hypothetical protein ACRC35_03550 [Angustibacter sp.]